MRATLRHVISMGTTSRRWMRWVQDYRLYCISKLKPSLLEPACRKYYMTPKKLMASGEGGPNPAGWNKLTPEQVRLAIEFRIDDESFRWLHMDRKKDRNTDQSKRWSMLAWPAWEIGNKMSQLCWSFVVERLLYSKRAAMWLKLQKNVAHIFMAEQCMKIPGWFDNSRITLSMTKFHEWVQ